MFFTGRWPCFFFPWKKKILCVKIFRLLSVKVLRSPWKNLEKCPWKPKRLRENIFEITCVKIDLGVREIFWKFLPWKLKSAREKTYTILFQMLRRFSKPSGGEVVFGKKIQSTLLRQIETKITLKKWPTFSSNLEIFQSRRAQNTEKLKTPSKNSVLYIKLIIIQNQSSPLGQIKI